MRDATWSGKGRVWRGCCRAGRESGEVPVSWGSTSSVLGEIICVLEAGGCLEGLAVGKGFGSEMWKGAQGSYKGKGSSLGVIWIHFEMGLRCKSHLPGIFGDPRNPSGAREAGGHGWLCSSSAQHGNRSSGINSLIFGDASRLPPSLGTHMAQHSSDPREFWCGRRNLDGCSREKRDSAFLKGL